MRDGCAWIQDEHGMSKSYSCCAIRWRGTNILLLALLVYFPFGLKHVWLLELSKCPGWYVLGHLNLTEYQWNGRI